MKYCRIISKSLAIFAVVGMLLTPIMRPAIAMPAADMMDMTGNSATMDLDKDMSCCPDQVPMSECSTECPFVGLCMAGNVLNLPAGISLALQLKPGNMALPDNDPDFTGLTHGPPLRPPQS